MLVSNCCGVTGHIIAEEMRLCEKCGDSCDYIEEEDFRDTEELKDKMKSIHDNYPHLDYVNPEYRKYHGKIKPADND